MRKEECDVYLHILTIDEHGSALQPGLEAVICYASRFEVLVFARAVCVDRFRNTAAKFRARRRLMIENVLA